MHVQPNGDGVVTLQYLASICLHLKLAEESGESGETTLDVRKCAW